MKQRGARAATRAWQRITRTGNPGFLMRILLHDYNYYNKYINKSSKRKHIKEGHINNKDSKGRYIKEKAYIKKKEEDIYNISNKEQRA
jgi:hypothetical protein